MANRLCVFGDSIVYGYDDADKGGWCDRLKQEYFKGDEWSVYNLGISGDTSESVAERFKNECGARLPKIILVAVGLNDSTFDRNLNKCRVASEKTEENLERFIEVAKKINSEIVFIGLTRVVDKLLTPVPWQKNLSYSNENVKKYDAVIRRVAEENNVPYCPMFDLLDDKDLSDGLHPNSVGHRKMFERIRGFLEEKALTKQN